MEATLTPRPAKQPSLRHILEPVRHVVEPRAPPTLAYGVHVRRLDVRLRKIHPDRHPAPAAPRTPRFAGKKAKATGFAAKRLEDDSGQVQLQSRQL